MTTTKRAHSSRARTRATAAKSGRARPTRRWSKQVTEKSDVLVLEPSVFKRGARAIALSLKRSAERSTRRKSAPFRSAMSMLTFYQNRAGRNLTPAQKHKLERAKLELRKLYDRA